MAVSKWLMRKSFDEATAKADQIKVATKIKDSKNAGLFTPSQEKLREELGLHKVQLREDALVCKCCQHHAKVRLAKASRSRLRIT